MSDEDKIIAIEILNIFQDKYLDSDVPFLESELLSTWLNNSQIKLIDYIMELKPLNESVIKIPEHSNIKKICMLPSNADEEQITFVRIPINVDSAFNKLQVACFESTGYTLNIISGYRSRAYQAILFLRELYDNEFDFAHTLAKIMPPGYSEHGDAYNPAIDIAIKDNPYDDYLKYVYPWLSTNASKYGFKESYKLNNGSMDWEPWHWRLNV